MHSIDLAKWYGRMMQMLVEHVKRIIQQMVEWV